MSIICTICARTGSTGLKNKNFLKIKGKTLITYTINAALKSKIFDRIVVSIDKSKFSLGQYKNKILFVSRPKILATNSSKKVDAIRHAVNICELKTKKNTIIFVI